jgi:uncharacterized protein YggE
MFVLTKAPAAAALPAADPPDKRAGRWVRVAGDGSIEVTPDTAHVATGVITEAATAREALTANNAVMRKVVDGLKTAGIAAKDMQTQQFQILPRYKNFKDRGMQQIEAYVVRNRIQVKVRDVARVGEILDRAVKLGAKEGSDISFSVSNAEKRKDKARKKAIENATHRARLLAEASGAKLGPVLTISEEAVHPPQRPVMLARNGDMSDDTVPIEGGTETLSVRVEVLFALE